MSSGEVWWQVRPERQVEELGLCLRANREPREGGELKGTQWSLDNQHEGHTQDRWTCTFSLTQNFLFYYIFIHPRRGRSPGGGHGNPTPVFILAWRIPWTEEPGRQRSIELQSQTWLKRLSTHGLDTLSLVHACLGVCRGTKWETPKSLWVRKQLTLLR